VSAPGVMSSSRRSWCADPSCCAAGAPALSVTHGPDPESAMARLFWLTVMAAFVAALLAGASWAAPLMAVGTLLGAPPPGMGDQASTFLWRGAPPPGRPPPGGGLSVRPPPEPGP